MNIHKTFIVVFIIEIIQKIQMEKSKNGVNIQFTRPKILGIKVLNITKLMSKISIENIRSIKIEIKSFGMDFLLELQRTSNNYCQFTGFVNRSPAVMSEFNLCNGMEGIFQWKNEIYFIKPTPISKALPGFSNPGSKLLPHQIYFEDLRTRKPLFSCKLINNKYANDNIPDDTNKYQQYQPTFPRSKRNTDPDYPVIETEFVEDHRIELLIVVTNNFYKRFQKDLNKYILNNVVIATNLLRHPTINASISIDIVDIIILDETYEIINNLHNWTLLSQDNVVTRFCKWLKMKKQSLPYFYDSAILINDGYFSSNAIGIAHLRSMCTDNNCLAVVDRGFGTGFIMAHELAHQMNARHDYDDAEDCRIYETKGSNEIFYNTVMSTSLYFENYPFVWSLCSQFLINSFLRSKFSYCLKEQNSNPNRYSHEDIIEHLQRFSTGADYDLNQQCSFAFGQPAEFCFSQYSNPRKCSTLYCRLENHPLCIRADAIIADGTECDLNKRCVHGKCVAKDKLMDPIHGGWSEYTSWSNCTRPCDGGVQFSHRFCNKPVPSLGGRYCIGTKERIRSCNVSPCSNPLDSRRELCKKYNLKPYIPQIDEEFACNLVCITKNHSLKYDITLTDGTPCSPLHSDICVKGTCYKTGCDKVVGSKKVFDNCNKCGGNNETCFKKDGFFDGSKVPQVQMMTAFKVPANVTNLFIQKISDRQFSYSNEVYDDFELLLVVDRRTVIRRSKSIEPLAGGQLYYSGTNKNIETIEIRGQINKEIVVIIKIENQDTLLPLPSIEYHYYIQKEKFIWKYLEVNERLCKKRCNGYIEIAAACFQELDHRRVMDQNCSESEKPEILYKNCSSMCGYRWSKPDNEYIQGEINYSCPINCGIGQLKILFFCQENFIMENNKSLWRTVNVSQCIAAYMTERPYMNVVCEGQCIPPAWKYGKWKECPVECGPGFQYRSSICMDVKRNFHNRDICLKNWGSPDDKKVCLSFINCWNLTKWVTSSWSKCSKTCGIGIQNRFIYCLRSDNNSITTESIDETILKQHEQLSDAFCKVHKNKPITERRCLIENCFEWVLDKEGKCSVTCGRGSLFQNYVCKRKPNGQSMISIVDDELCLQNNLTKPKSVIKICSNNTCPVISLWVTGKWNKCSVSCGEGVKQRTIKCGFKAPNNTLVLWSNNDKCQNITPPKTIRKCMKRPCPIWVYGSWSECEGICLYGRQHRSIICTEPNSDKILPNSHCNTTIREPHFKKCILSRLCGYWTIGKWSHCSVSCGLGVKTRAVKCHHSNGTKSNDPLICKSPFPFDEIQCQYVPCQFGSFFWLMKKSECYGYSCNPGIAYTIVRCVNQQIDVLPETKCADLPHPNYYIGCLKKHCQRYFWKEESWDNIPCISNGCMMTVRSRDVECVDDFGISYPDSYCDESNKPDTWRLCPSPRKCSDVPRNCKEFKKIHPESKDGEYSLAIDLNWTYYIYCADMNTEEPKEYLTLKELNYARSSKYISTHSNYCSINEEIEHNHTCPGCQIDESLRSITYYDKIRVNLSDLSVDVMDNRFSMTNGLSYMPYATAKDCVGSLNCPKGHFKIDLRGTGFSISMRTVWNERYPKYGYRINRSQASQIVKGWCGGNCIGCSPLDKLYLEPQMYGREFEVKSNEIL